MKHSGVQIYNTGDEWPAGGIQIVSHDPIPGNAGWNLIGGYEDTLAVASITTNPPGLQDGPVFGFNGIYTTPSEIQPGYGYWLKLSGAGQIILPDVMAKVAGQKEWFKKDWGKILISDASGKKFTLYSVTAEVDLNQYELPPLPQQGMFDIRYGSGRIAENLKNSEQMIEMHGIIHPVILKVDNMSISLKDESAEEINIQLRSGEQYTINNNAITKLRVSADELTPPIEYRLEQNYPNPFNPSTTIRFDLPAAGHVKLILYNILGQKIKTFFDEFKSSGIYTVNLNLNGLNSGMYFYKMEVNGFSQSRKMILVK
jgi:hypothetical protein